MAEYTLPPSMSDELFAGDEPDTCDATVERTGEECGRDRPCPYHDD